MHHTQRAESSHQAHIGLASPWWHSCRVALPSLARHKSLAPRALEVPDVALAERRRPALREVHRGLPQRMVPSQGCKT